MTNENKVPILGVLKEALPDLVGLLGLALLVRGLWVGWGEAVALTACGSLLLVLSVVSVARGGR